MKHTKRKLNLFLLIVVVSSMARVLVSAAILPNEPVASLQFDIASKIFSQDIYFNGSEEVWYTYVPESSGSYDFLSSGARLSVYDSEENRRYNVWQRYTLNQGETYYFHFERLENNVQDCVTVTIKPRISMEYKKIVGIAKGENRKLELSNQAWVQSAVWSSSDASVVSVDDSGEVTALAEGTVTISVSACTITGDMFSDSVEILVTNPELSQTKLSVNLGTGYLITWGDNAGKYYECDGNVLKVQGVTKDSTIEVMVLDDKGEQTENLYVTKRYDYDEDCYRIRFFPNNTGKYIAEIKADGKLFCCELNVFNLFFDRHSKTVADQGSKTWQAKYSMLALYPNETAKLVLNGTEGKVSWKSSDKQVAVVSSHGKVTAKRAGYAKISATCQGITVTYLVGVADKTAILAVRECCEMYGKTSYSQEKRMKDGYADCSSFVWKGYKAAGRSLGNATYAPTAAGLSDWCKQKGYRIFYGAVDLAALLPGDLIFECGSTNGRSDGIYHVDIYLGNYAALTVKQEKWYGVWTRDSEVSFLDVGYGHDYLLQCFWDGSAAKNTLNDVIVARPCMSEVSSVVVKDGGNGRQMISWEQLYGVTGYEIYQSTSLNGSYKKVATVKGCDTVNWISEKLVKDRTYYYTIRPYWKSNKTICRGGSSAVVSAKVK